MQIETRSLEATDSATSQHWFVPLAMLVAWLARLLEQITKLKRIRHTTKFKPNWRDHFESLRRCEWHRDQLLAAGAAQLLAGKELDLDALEILADPPDDYGGPCPGTPFAMNRRFLALARWKADPAAAVRKHKARIAKRAGIDLSTPLAAHGSTDAQVHCAAHHELVGLVALVSARSAQALILSSAQSARPSKDERGSMHARAPPDALGLP